MMSSIELILYLLLACVGGWDIGNAVKDFKNGRYFMFGVDIMVSIWAVSGFLRLNWIL